MLKKLPSSIMARSQQNDFVLIADANPEDVKVLKMMLAPTYDIKVAVDGEEAFRLASSPDTPGLILMNTMLPATDIYEVCRKLKGHKTTKDIPIVLLSEPTTEDAEAKGFEAGAADYITKPFKDSVVSARVKTQLELKHYRDRFDSSVKKRVRGLQAELKERREIEDTYRALVEHAKDGIAIIHDFKVRFTNSAFCKMTGYSEEELLGAHLKKFISEEEFVKNTTRYSDRIAGLNLPRIYHSQVIHSDGSIIDVELNVCVVPYGRSLAALVFVRDIGEEKAWRF